VDEILVYPGTSGSIHVQIKDGLTFLDISEGVVAVAVDWCDSKQADENSEHQAAGDSD